MALLCFCLGGLGAAVTALLRGRIAEFSLSIVVSLALRQLTALLSLGEGGSVLPLLKFSLGRLPTGVRRASRTSPPVSLKLRVDHAE